MNLRKNKKFPQMQEIKNPCGSFGLAGRNK
jgi:hypothetical protein